MKSPINLASRVGLGLGLGDTVGLGETLGLGLTAGSIVGLTEGEGLGVESTAELAVAGNKTTQSRVGKARNTFHLL